ncbi:Hypothetical Protein FCC1311_038272 [Hondaea fermentalgiana]|uniref:Uncharacterized protein n=1 Tax=Hondaea fermentalgiana TaxID=2315210 RepID=A0A2R5GIA4_9STRA|nr:Hypothetical Protein FCC1311_038272 [Hondaea fermentalgiana]|eukprot:GBG27604.1 Hypothetical Protein FCC1311_038272 [Hondaea fermentalgiana]
MDNLKRVLAELLTDFDTVRTARREYQLMLDDVIHTSNAEYVTEAVSGFFPDNTQPAYRYLRAAVRLVKAAEAADPAARLGILDEALDDAESARWDGVDQNTKQIHDDVPTLRHDANARSADEYNHKLAELYNQAGDLYNRASNAREQAETNMFAAIAQIATLCSFPDAAPFQLSKDERNAAVRKIEEMVKFARRVTQAKVPRN